MFNNRGFVEDEIPNLNIWIKDKGWWELPFEQRRGSLVFSHNGQTAWIVLKYGRREAVYRFPERELDTLWALLKQEGGFVFKSKGGSGALKLHRISCSNDMTVEFPSGERVHPQQKDFRRAIQAMMRKKLTDLDKMYPEIAEVVNQITSYDSEVIVWALAFSTRGRGPAHLARYRGDLTKSQAEELRRVAEVPIEVEPAKKGEWVEFYRLGELTSFKFLEVDTFGYTPDYWNVMHLGRQRYKATSVFCNGRRLSGEEFSLDTKPRPRSKPGDVFVFVHENGQIAGSDLSFEEMPLVEVFRAPERVGPFVHPEMIGKTVLQVVRSRKLRGYFGLRRGDKAICPHCGEANCSQYQLTREDELWVEKAGTGEEFLFAFQAPNLIGSDGTARFRPWAPLVIGRHVRGMDWPPEIISLELDGEDITAATCNVKVRKGSKLKVVLRRKY